MQAKFAIITLTEQQKHNNNNNNGTYVHTPIGHWVKCICSCTVNKWNSIHIKYDGSYP